MSHMVYDKKKAFNPPLVARGINLLWSNDATARLDPTTAVSRLITSRSTRWKRHPGIAVYLWMGRFGPGQLSIAHFFPLSEEEQEAWNENGRVAMDTFVKIFPPQPPPILSSIADIIKCVRALKHHFLVYGSDLLISFTRNAVEFLEGAETYLPTTLCLPHHIRRLSSWVDQCFRDLFCACHDDVINGTYTHLHIGSCFYLTHERHTKGPSLDFLRQELMLMEPPKSLSAPSRLPGKPQEPHKDTHKPSAPTRTVIPQTLYRHLPKVDGKSVCLKNLTRNGCSLAKCQRKHVIVHDLHSKVRDLVWDTSYGGGPCADLRKE